MSTTAVTLPKRKAVVRALKETCIEMHRPWPMPMVPAQGMSEEQRGSAWIQVVDTCLTHLMYDGCKKLLDRLDIDTADTPWSELHTACTELVIKHAIRVTDEQWPKLPRLVDWGVLEWFEVDY